MITEHMQLNSASDADVWAAQLGLETAEQEARVSDWIWNAKPHIGCTWAEFEAANAETLESERFWKIAEGAPKTPKHAVQIPSADGGSETIGYAATAEEASELAKRHGVNATAELYARLDYCEWHVGF